MPHDERPLPAIRRTERPVESALSSEEQRSPQPGARRAPHSPEVSGEPEPLTETAQREAGLPLEVYGESVVRRIIWKHPCVCFYLYSYILLCTRKNTLLGNPSGDYIQANIIVPIDYYQDIVRCTKTPNICLMVLVGQSER